MCLAVKLDKYLPFYEGCIYYKLFYQSEDEFKILTALHQGKDKDYPYDVSLKSEDYSTHNHNIELTTDDASQKYDSGFHAWADFDSAKREYEYNKKNDLPVVLKKVFLHKITAIGLQKFNSIRAYGECVVGQEMTILKDDICV